MADMAKIKNHPGFLAFWGGSATPVKKEETQAGDQQKAKAEVEQDAQYAGNNAGGGDGSKG